MVVQAQVGIFFFDKSDLRVHFNMTQAYWESTITCKHVLHVCHTSAPDIFSSTYVYECVYVCVNVCTLLRTRVCLWALLYVCHQHVCCYTWVLRILVTWMHVYACIQMFFFVKLDGKVLWTDVHTKGLLQLCLHGYACTSAAWYKRGLSGRNLHMHVLTSAGVRQYVCLIAVKYVCMCVCVCVYIYIYIYVCVHVCM